jgi:hypothetical protein
MALANNANENLPVVQAAKVSHSTSQGTQGTTESQTTISKPDQLSTTLVNALKEAAHTSVDGQPAVPSSSSFANAFFLSLTEKSGEKATSNSLSKSTSLSESGSSTSTSTQTKDPTTKTTDPAKATSTSTKTDDPTTKTTDPAKATSTSTKTDDPTTKTTDPAKANDPPAKPPSEKTPDLAAVLQDFFKHTSDWKLVNDGSTVVVYDTSALTHHPTELKGLTFDFSDGSTLSLVGLPATFAHSLVV